MTLLVLDTVRLEGGVALAREGELAAHTLWTEKQRHSERLWPDLLALLEEQLLTLDDLGGVVASVGPGRLTGLRIGLAVAKQICLAKSLPLIGVNLFEQVAQSAALPESDQCLVVIAEGFSGTWAFQTFTPDGAEGDFATVAEADFAAVLTERIGQRAPLFAGPGIAHWQAEWETQWPASVISLTTDQMLAGLARAGEKHLRADETLDPATARPIYL